MTRWGAYDGSMNRFGFSPLPPVSGTRYRRLRFTRTWTEDYASPAGTRIDEVDFGNGLNPPTYSVPRADPPFENINLINIPIHGTHTHSMNAAEAHSDGLWDLAVEYLDSEDFADSFRDEMYAELSALNAYTTRVGEFGNTLTRSRYSKGPVKNGFFIIGQGALGNEMRFDDVIEGNDDEFLFGGPAVIYGGMARILYGSRAFQASVGSLGEVTLGFHRISLQFWHGSVMKTLALVGSGNEWTYREAIPNVSDAVGGEPAVQLDCARNKTIQGGIIQPPDAAHVTEWSSGVFRHVFPPMEQNRVYVGLAGIRPNCF